MIKRFYRKYGDFLEGSVIIIVLFTLVVSVLVFGCSSPPSTGTEIPTTETSFTPLQYPNRYIDWQAEVVCYYLGDTAISCMPLSDTKIIIGVQR
jgi:hypothetical protein